MHDDLSDEQLLRYSRQIMLPAFDVEGQLRLLNSHVLIVGLGGLGSPVAMYLAAAGVGTLTLVDDDEVDLSNLQRQIVHRSEMLGRSKVLSAKAALQALNPETVVHTVAQRLEGDRLRDVVQNVDLIVDCSDNFTTRFALNRLSVELQRPLVSGAAIRMEGQISVFDPRRDDSPCYQCLYGEGADENLSCSEAGVMAPLVGVIGSMQALEAIKVLSASYQDIVGRLLMFDAAHGEWRQLRLRKDPQCPCCANQLA